MINKGISKNKSKGKQKSKVSTRTKHNGRLNVNKGTKTKKQKLNTLLNYNGNKSKKNVKSTGFKTKKKHYVGGGFLGLGRGAVKMFSKAGTGIKRATGVFTSAKRGAVVASGKASLNTIYKFYKGIMSSFFKNPVSIVKMCFRFFPNKNIETILNKMGEESEDFPKIFKQKYEVNAFKKIVLNFFKAIIKSNKFKDYQTQIDKISNCFNIKNSKILGMGVGVGKYCLETIFPNENSRPEIVDFLIKNADKSFKDISNSLPNNVSPKDLLLFINSSLCTEICKLFAIMIKLIAYANEEFLELLNLLNTNCSDDIITQVEGGLEKLKRGDTKAQTVFEFDNSKIPNSKVFHDISIYYNIMINNAGEDGTIVNDFVNNIKEVFEAMYNDMITKYNTRHPNDSYTGTTVDSPFNLVNETLINPTKESLFDGYDNGEEDDAFKSYNLFKENIFNVNNKEGGDVEKTAKRTNFKLNHFLDEIGKAESNEIHEDSFTERLNASFEMSDDDVDNAIKEAQKEKGEAEAEKEAEVEAEVEKAPSDSSSAANEGEEVAASADQASASPSGEAEKGEAEAQKEEGEAAVLSPPGDGEQSEPPADPAGSAAVEPPDEANPISAGTAAAGAASATAVATAAGTGDSSGKTAAEAALGGGRRRTKKRNKGKPNVNHRGKQVNKDSKGRKVIHNKDISNVASRKNKRANQNNRTKKKINLKNLKK